VLPKTGGGEEGESEQSKGGRLRSAQKENRLGKKKDAGKGLGVAAA